MSHQALAIGEPGIGTLRVNDEATAASVAGACPYNAARRSARAQRRPHLHRRSVDSSPLLAIRRLAGGRARPTSRDCKANATGVRHECFRRPDLDAPRLAGRRRPPARPLARDRRARVHRLRRPVGGRRRDAVERAGLGVAGHRELGRWHSACAPCACCAPIRPSPSRCRRTSPHACAARAAIFLWTNVAEGVAILLAVNLVANLGHPQWQTAAVMAIVGLHFLPLAVGFGYRPHVVTGVAMTAWAAGLPVAVRGGRDGAGRARWSRPRSCSRARRGRCARSARAR